MLNASHYAEHFGFWSVCIMEAVNASFTATSSYVGPPAEHQAGSPQAWILLKQYLEAVLGLADLESGGSSGRPTEFSQGQPQVHHGTFGDTMKAGGSSGTSSYSGQGAVGSSSTMGTVSSSSPMALLTGTMLLCLVCSQLSLPNSVLANHVAKSCSKNMGVVFDASSDIPKAAIQVCELVAEKTRANNWCSTTTPYVKALLSGKLLGSDTAEQNQWGNVSSVCIISQERDMVSLGGDFCSHMIRSLKTSTINLDDPVFEGLSIQWN